MSRLANGRDPWIDAMLEAAFLLPPADEMSHVYVEEREDFRLEIDSWGGSGAVGTRSRGAAVRIGGGRQAFLAGATPSDLAELVRKALTGGSMSVPARGTPTSGVPESISLDRKRAHELAARLLHLATSTGPSCTPSEATVRYVGFEQGIQIARREEGVEADLRMGGRLVLELTAELGGRRAHAMGEAARFLDQPGQLESLALSTRERLAAHLETPVEVPSTTRVAFAPSVGGILVHEIVGHALEADTGSDDFSALGAAGNEIGPEAIEVVDDPRRSRAPWSIDDEGEAAREVVLIGGGRVAGRLHDLRTARATGASPSGHGRRSSFQEEIRPRMGCTYLVPGKASAADVLDDVGDGIYVRRIEAAHVDSRTGMALFRVLDADRIRRGRIDGTLPPVVMMVQAAEALASMRCIAGDLEFDRCTGSCLRDGQPLVASVGAPTFCIGLARLFL